MRRRSNHRINVVAVSPLLRIVLISKMKFGTLLLKLTLNVSLLFGTTNLFISEVSGYEMVVINHLIVHAGVKPVHYDVRLTLDPKNQTEEQSVFFKGECHITVLISFPTNYIILYAQKSYVKIYGVKMFEIYLRETENRVTHFIHVGNNIKIYFAEELYGDFRLELYFNSQTSNEEFFKTSYKNGTEHIMLSAATHLRPARTSALFPCWDEPQVKTNFSFSITFESKYMVLSNMLEQYHFLVDKPAKNMINLHFHETFETSTYDIAIVIFDRHHFSQDETWYRRNATKYTEFAQMIADKVIRYLTYQFLSILKIRSANHIVIPGFPHDAMAKFGLNIFREEAILYNAYADHLAIKLRVAQLVARVVVHERLNNLVNPIWWSDLWLNEAIAILFGQDAVNELFPNLHLLDLFVVQFHQESLRLDIDSVIGPVTPIFTSSTNVNTIFSFSYYIKGPVILYMLERLIGDEIFWQGVNKYVAYKTTTINDFYYAMQTAINKSALPNILKFNVKKVMNTWLKQTNYPVVNVIRNASNIKIQIDNINITDDLCVPITVTTQSDLNFTLIKNWHLLPWLIKKGKVNRTIHYFLNFNDDDWIIVNLQQIGYYRVKYDDENWQKITKYLNSDNYTNIHVLNRAQILDDAFYFVMTGQINLDMFADLIRYLSREKDYVAWYPMIKNLEYISSFFPYEESTFIKENIQTPLNNIFYELTYKKEAAKDDIANFLKEEVAKWACILGSEICKNDAITYLEFEYQQTNIQTWWKHWIYCEGLTRANFTTWRKIFDIFLNETDNKMLKFLACSENPNIIWNYMNLITHNKEIQDRISNKGIMNSIDIFHSIVARHAKNSIILDHILDNFDRLRPSKINAIVAITDIINHIYSPRHLYKVRKFAYTYKFPDYSLVTGKMFKRLVEIEEHKQHFLNFGRLVEK